MMEKWLYCAACALLEPIKTDTRIGVWGDGERQAILGHIKVTDHTVVDIPHPNGVQLIVYKRAKEGKLRREFSR